MIKRRLYIALFILAFAPIAWCQVPISSETAPVLKYNCKKDSLTLTLERGDGSLYDFGGGARATKQGYRRIYYLFTDSPKVYISNSSTGTPMYSASFKYNDTSSYWFSDNKYYAEPKIPVYDLRNCKGIGFHWTNRAHVLFDTWDNTKTDSTKTVFLVVLPQPPIDSFFTQIKLSKKHFSHDSLRANLHIERTGRIVFDSIYIEGIPPEDFFYHGDERHKNDTPYYLNNAYADLSIHVPCLKTQDSITATIYYTLLNTTGSITHHYTELKIPVKRINFPFIPVGIGIVLAAALSVMLLEINKQRKASTPEREARRTEHNRDKEKIEKLRNNVSQLEKQLKDANDAIAKSQKNSEAFRVKIKNQEKALEELEQKVKDAQNREYTAEDSAEFRQRCLDVCKDIDTWAEDLQQSGNMVLANKLLDLEMKIYIKQTK